MVSVGYNFNLAFQKTVNNILEESNQSCTAVDNVSINDNDAIITGNNIGGNVQLFTVGASTDASCSMVSTMQTSVTNILNSTLSQENKSSSDWMSGVNVGLNASAVVQNLQNNIYQISNQSCTSNSITSANNNYIYAADNNISGNFVGVSLQSDSDANCAMTNYMKINLFNQSQATTNQSNTVTGSFGIIAIIVVVIIIVMICGVIYANRSKIASASASMNPATAALAGKPKATAVRTTVPTTGVVVK